MPPPLEPLGVLARAGSKEFVRDLVEELYRLRDAAAFPEGRRAELCEVLQAEPAEVEQMFAAGRFVVRECVYRQVRSRTPPPSPPFAPAPAATRRPLTASAVGSQCSPSEVLAADFHPQLRGGCLLPPPSPRRAPVPPHAAEPRMRRGQGCWTRLWAASCRSGRSRPARTL